MSSSKLFSKRTSKTFGHLWIQSGADLTKTLSISQLRWLIRHPIRNYQEQKPDQNSKSLSTSVGITNMLDQAFKGRACNNGVCKNLSYITCFNCDKKSHYVDKCSEPRKGHNVAEDEQLFQPSLRQ